ICFFQAEDGIRDSSVTGVRRVLFRSTIGAQTIKANLFKRSELTEQRRVAIGLAQLGLKPGDRIAILGRACNNPFARLGRFKIIEIGRASCRERVWLSLVVV